MRDDQHHEKHLEDYIVQKLTKQGWLLGSSDHYDQDHALYPEDIEGWLKATQPAKWERLVAMQGDDARKVLMDKLEAALEKNGPIHVLRRGFAIAGCGQIDMSEAAPEDQRNQKIIDRYAANRLRVVPQLKYKHGHKDAIDLGFFLMACLSPRSRSRPTSPSRPKRRSSNTSRTGFRWSRGRSASIPS